MKQRDLMDISGALNYACVRLGNGSQKVGREIIGKKCGKSAAMVGQWIEQENIHHKCSIIVDRLCLEAFGERPMAVAHKAMTGRVSVKVSVRNMALRVQTLSGRIATASLEFSQTGCARARESLQTSIGKLQFKLHKIQAGIAR